LLGAVIFKLLGFDCLSPAFIFSHLFLHIHSQRLRQKLLLQLLTPCSLSLLLKPEQLLVAGKRNLRVVGDRLTCIWELLTNLCFILKFRAQSLYRQTVEIL